MLIASELEKVGPGGEERFGLRPTSFFRNLLYSIKDNSTFSLRHRATVEAGQHGWRELRNTPEHKKRERKEQEARERELKERRERNERNERLWRKHQARRPRPRYLIYFFYKLLLHRPVE